MFYSCFSSDRLTREFYRARKLEMLKAMRDALETRLAALNAAIETIERQQGSDGAPPASSPE